VYLINTIFLKLATLSISTTFIATALRDIDLEIMVVSGIESGRLSALILAFWS
jgi:hypothetical protein